MLSERYWLIHNWIVTRLVGYALIAIGSGLLFLVGTGLYTLATK